jgi:prephenate dehydratase
MTDAAPTTPEETYSYLGPAGTFTEAALKQVPEASGKHWRSVNNVGEALADVTSGRSTAAMIAIENSIEGGVSATQDALATVPGLRILGEYLVPVNFVLVARPGTALADVRVVNAHPVAYAQSRGWLERELPDHGHLPATSNVQAASSLFDPDSNADAAVAPPGIVEHLDVDVLARDIGDNPNAVTRFVLVSRSRVLPAPTGADKTSLIVELPTDEPGALLAMLEQFSTRGVNLSLLESRPIGDALGRYRFVVDLDGHIADERVADALLGLRRTSPNVIFLGSYPRADKREIEYHSKYDDEIFIEARDWLRGLLSGEPGGA